MKNPCMLSLEEQFSENEVKLAIWSFIPEKLEASTDFLFFSKNIGIPVATHG